MIPRIKKRADFLKVSHQGVKARMRHFTVLGAYNHDQNSMHKTRIGFTASKRVGNAVHRNRAKRRMRTLIDSLLLNCISSSDKDQSTVCIDFVIIAHQSLIDAHRENLEQEVKTAIKMCLTKLKKSWKLHPAK